MFGSVVRGEDDLDSDVDLLVDYDVDAGLVPIVELKRALEELLGERVDIAPTALLKASVARSALAEAIPL